MPVYGKLGDLIGRKSIFIAAIAMFMVGSVIGGLAHSMTWLIIGRAVQGLGGGGLMILSQAIIADVIPARQRGKYMGIMGGVFAVSSVAGPLLGRLVHRQHRLALGVLDEPSAGRPRDHCCGVLPAPSQDTNSVRGSTSPGSRSSRSPPPALVFTSVWGGTTYAWDSAPILSLIALTVVSAVGFVLVERRAAEPLMPLKMFRERNFVLATSAGLIIGLAMFGAFAYMPTYLQMVTGAGATQGRPADDPVVGRTAGHVDPLRSAWSARPAATSYSR